MEYDKHLVTIVVKQEIPVFLIDRKISQISELELDLGAGQVAVVSVRRNGADVLALLD